MIGICGNSKSLLWSVFALNSNGSHPSSNPLSIDDNTLVFQCSYDPSNSIGAKALRHGALESDQAGFDLLFLYPDCEGSICST